MASPIIGISLTILRRVLLLYIRYGKLYSQTADIIQFH